ncbi:AAA family ATPase [Cypionkella sp.]|uniref:AAA family ATPase n=1 Tax=Cypionkella sp. TaxID=2811411 RepID=UPI002ABAF9C1|nr:AAA family ATPase [Cypionkella sp.]MDZ4394994.1 AAA family ATPase [Cypionkella sp.]
MQRIMVVGQPGSGKSTLARMLGARTGLPVVHMDQIHWQPGWIERSRDDKDRLCAEVEALPAWIFEGGHSRTYDSRAARADLLIWLDVPIWRRLWRVSKRTLLGRGRTRPDLPENCPEMLRKLPEFYRFIWRSRHVSRDRIVRLLAEVRPDLPVVFLRNLAELRAYVATLPDLATLPGHDKSRG